MLSLSAGLTTIPPTHPIAILIRIHRHMRYQHSRLYMACYITTHVRLSPPSICASLQQQHRPHDMAKKWIASPTPPAAAPHSHDGRVASFYYNPRRPKAEHPFQAHPETHCPQTRTRPSTDSDGNPVPADRSHTTTAGWLGGDEVYRSCERAGLVAGLRYEFR